MSQLSLLTNSNKLISSVSSKKLYQVKNDEEFVMHNMAARPDPYGLKTDPQRQMKMMMEHKKNFDGGVQSRLPTVTNSNAHGARSNSEVRLKPRQIAKQDNSYMDESSVNTTLMSEH